MKVLKKMNILGQMMMMAMFVFTALTAHSQTSLSQLSAKIDLGSDNLGLGSVFVNQYIPEPTQTPFPNATPVPRRDQLDRVTFSGSIDSDTTWSGEMFITGDVTVNAALTIEPGTIIRIDPKFDIEISGINIALTEIIVTGSGSINALGTADQPIIFTSDADNPQNNDWYGIRLQTDNVAFSHVTVDCAQHILSIEGGSNFTFNNCDFSNASNEALNIQVAEVNMSFNSCDFTSSNKWIEAGSGLEGSLVFDGCFVANHQQATDFQMLSLTINNTQIINHSSHVNRRSNIRNSLVITDSFIVGFYFELLSNTNGSLVASNSDFNTVTIGLNLNRNNGNELGAATITDCNFEHSIIGFLGGIYEVQNCTFRDHTSEFIRVLATFASTSLTIDNCEFAGSESKAINIASSNPTINLRNSKIVQNNIGIDFRLSNEINVVIDNCIIDQNDVGISYQINNEIASLPLSNSSVYGNNIGISISGSGNSSDPITLASGNDISRNVDYEIENRTSRVFVGDDNYYGEPTTSELAAGERNLSKIFDVRDQDNLGPVIIRTWADLPFDAISQPTPIPSPPEVTLAENTVIVTDSRSSQENLIGSVDMDESTARELFIRWNLQPANYTEFHVYTSYNGGTNRFVGAVPASQNFLDWSNFSPDKVVLQSEFKDGPQFGVEYAFTVFGILGGGSNNNASTNGVVLFQELDPNAPTATPTNTATPVPNTPTFTPTPVPPTPTPEQPSDTITTSGTITGAEVWSGDILLTGDITIASGGSVTVEPGTNIKVDVFDATFGGSDPDRIEFIVNDGGSLMINGTENSPVTIHSSDANGGVSKWYGFRFLTDNIAFNSVTVENTFRALNFESDGTFEFNHYRGKNTDKHFVLSALASTYNLTFNQTHFLQNDNQSIIADLFYIDTIGQSDGIDAELNFVESEIDSKLDTNFDLRFGVVVNKVIKLNNTSWKADAVFGSNAIVEQSNLSGEFEFRANSIVEDSIFLNSIIEIRSNSNGSASNSRVIGCNFDNSPLILLESSIVVENCQFMNYLELIESPSYVSVGGAIQIDSFASDGVQILNSNITNNGVGIIIGGVVQLPINSFTLSGCKITNNTIGIALRDINSGFVITPGNDIFSNTSYDIKNHSNGAVANGNYFGEPTTSELTNGVTNLTKIHDIRDDSTLGPVVIQEWATEPFVSQVDPTATPTQEPPATPTPGEPAGDILVSIENQVHAPGSTFSVAVQVQNAPDTTDFTLSLSYDPNVIANIFAINPVGGLAENFGTFIANTSEPGLIGIIAASQAPDGTDAGPFSGDGLLFTIEGMLTENAGASMQFNVTNNIGGLEGAQFNGGTLSISQEDNPTPTPTSTPIPSPGFEPEIIRTFEFDQSGLAANGWGEVPGGFGGAQPGTAVTQAIDSSLMTSSEDNLGLAVTVRPGQVAFINTSQPINTDGAPVLLRITARADGAGAALALVALKGSLTTGENLDGSIATLIPANTQSLVDQEKRMVLVYQPDTGTIFSPCIQLASTSPIDTVTVYIDKLEVLKLSEEVFGSTP